MTEYAPVATAAVANMDSNLTGIHTPSCRVPGPDRASREVSQSALSTRVADGTRTHDHRDHNPGLYQLSYRHRERRQDSPESQRTESTIRSAGVQNASLAGFVVCSGAKWSAVKFGFEWTAISRICPTGKRALLRRRMRSRAPCPPTTVSLS